MKAIVKRNKHIEGVYLENIKEPCLEEGDVKIKIHATGVCGTDLHIIRDEYPYNSPVIIGHEFSGTIEEISNGKSKFKKGDKVVAHTAAKTCGNCSYCRQGLIMLCNERKSIGSGVNGAFAEYIVIPEKNLFHIPANISLDEAVLTEPLACVVRCLMEQSEIKAGDKVLISGCGTIGLLALQVVIANGGLGVVTGTSADEKRFETAIKLGAKAVINIEEERVEKLKEVNNGKEYDVAIECAGSNSSLITCINVLKNQGSFIQVGLFGKKVLYDSDLVLMKEIKYSNGFATTLKSWEIALKLMEEDKINLLELISNRFHIDEWKNAFDSSLKKDGLKTIIYPTES